jgi:hypothetical protein
VDGQSPSEETFTQGTKKLGQSLNDNSLAGILDRAQGTDGIREAAFLPSYLCVRFFRRAFLSVCHGIVRLTARVWKELSTVFTVDIYGLFRIIIAGSEPPLISIANLRSLGSAVDVRVPSRLVVRASSDSLGRGLARG